MTNEDLAYQILNYSQIFYDRYHDELDRCILNNSEITGIITKENDYQIVAAVRYSDAKGRIWTFAKVRIFLEDGQIKIFGQRTGNYVSKDQDDDDLLQKPTHDLDRVLEAMLNNLVNVLTLKEQQIVIPKLAKHQN